MDSENSKTNEPHRFRLPLVNQLNLNKNMASTNLSIYNIWKNIKSAYSNNKFKISALTWNDKFDLPNGSYSIVDIQDYFEFIIKKHKRLQLKIFLFKFTQIFQSELELLSTNQNYYLQKQ